MAANGEVMPSFTQVHRLQWNAKTGGQARFSVKKWRQTSWESLVSTCHSLLEGKRGRSRAAR